MKKRNERRPKVGTIGYYIEEVVGYRAKCEREQGADNGYPPIVAELLLSILISVRAMRNVLIPAGGIFLGFLISLLLKGI